MTNLKKLLDAGVVIGSETGGYTLRCGGSFVFWNECYSTVLSTFGKQVS